MLTVQRPSPSPHTHNTHRITPTHQHQHHPTPCLARPQVVCEQLKVQSQNDAAKLAEAKQLVYLKVSSALACRRDWAGWAGRVVEWRLRRTQSCVHGVKTPALLATVLGCLPGHDGPARDLGPRGICRANPVHSHPGAHSPAGGAWLPPAVARLAVGA
jgi:hypothetical protein